MYFLFSNSLHLFKTSSSPTIIYHFSSHHLKGRNSCSTSFSDAVPEHSNSIFPQLKMSSSSLISANPSENSDRSSTRRKKKKKIQSHNLGENPNNNDQRQNSSIEWRSDAQQQIYSSKLFHALRQVRHGGGGSPGSKRVHEAADRVLAATARGRTRWSRAILTNRLKLKFMKKNNIVKRQSKVMTVITNGSCRRERKSKVRIMRLKSKSLPAVQRKARVLSRLVPGCRKEPLPVVLEEVTDYIAALEMQVRAMSALAELLSVSGSSSSGSDPNQLSSSTSGAPPR